MNGLKEALRPFGAQVDGVIYLPHTDRAASLTIRKGIHVMELAFTALPHS
ncbi:MAG: hypothetical protein JHC23_03330 [Sulfolobus sp.]|nr:hypothetical protein [Sulfolobus sp.]